jgi:hypothetical protein
MTISRDGTITWTPTEDQVGEHSVIVWLYDGDRSETGTVVVNVVEAPTFVELLVLLIAALMTVLVVALAIALMMSRRVRKRDGERSSRPS